MAAFLAQPAGFILCLATIGTMVYSLYVAATGSMIWVNWDRIGLRLMLGFGLLLIGGWMFKLVHGLLTGALPAK